MVFLKELITYNKKGEPDNKLLHQLLFLPECHEITPYIHDIADV